MILLKRISLILLSTSMIQMVPWKQTVLYTWRWKLLYDWLYQYTDIWPCISWNYQKMWHGFTTYSNNKTTAVPGASAVNRCQHFHRQIVNLFVHQNKLQNYPWTCHETLSWRNCHKTARDHFTDIHQLTARRPSPLRDISLRTTRCPHRRLSNLLSVTTYSTVTPVFQLPAETLTQNSSKIFTNTELWTSLK